MTTTLPRPTPLREFLDSGGDPRATLGDRFGFLLVRAVEAATEDDAGHRTRWAQLRRAEVEASIAGEALHLESADGTSTLEPIRDPAVLTVTAWDADMRDDPSLAARVLGLATDAERSEAAGIT